MNTRTIVGALILSVGAAAIPVALLAQTEAEAAWARGDMATAEQVYSQELAADSSNTLALRRMGLLLAWGEKYDRSLELYDRLLELAPDSLDARIERARVLAWRGDPAAAAGALQPVLDLWPGYLPALRAQAQFASWAGDFDLAIRTYGEVIRQAPDDRSARLENARVLSWAKRYPQAIDAFNTLLSDDPSDREARLGLARALAWSNERAAAELAYREMLQTDSQDQEALHGLAQAASWSGDLPEGERRWREILNLSPDDTTAWIGLSQNLRWQGRNGQALAAARRAAELAPDNPEARTQIRWAEAAVAPRLAPSTTYESDSDGNRIVTTSIAAAWSPLHWLQVRGDGYLRRAEQRTGTAFEREARGLHLSMSGRSDAGWLLTTTVGASESDGAAGLLSTLRANIGSPAHLPLSGTISYASAGLDATALMMERGLRIEETAIAARLQLPRNWALSARASGTVFSATEQNHRRLAAADLSHRLSQSWTFGATATAFDFRYDRNDGYFDPDFYGLAEVTGRWSREAGAWRVTAEGAPGVQQVGSRGSVTGAGRLSGGITYMIAPGREVGITAGYSTTGLDTLTPTDGGYRYHAIRMVGSWAW